MGADVHTPLLIDEEAGLAARSLPQAQYAEKLPPGGRRVGLVLSLLALASLMATFMCSPAYVETTSIADELNADSALRDVHTLLSTDPWTFVQLAEPGVTGQAIFDGWGLTKFHSYVVITTGSHAPSRRADEQAFLTVDTMMSLPAAGVVNRAAATVEAVLQRRLFPITLRSANFLEHLQDPFAPTQDSQTGVRPYVVFDLSNGELIVDCSITDSWSVDSVQFLIASLAKGVFGNMALMFDGLGAMTNPATVSGAAVMPLLTAAAALALPAAFAAAPPMWFCIACPTVLGLLAPLVINLGLGQLAGVACARLELTDDACFDLMLGSLGLGFVLSLASAVPIFMVCRMYECSHHDAPPSSLATRVLAPVLMRFR